MPSDTLEVHPPLMSIMSLFSANKAAKVRAVVLRLVNKHCPGRTAPLEDPRIDNRVDLVVAVMVVPIEEEQILVDRAFTTVTKDFSSTGAGIVLDRPCRFRQAILALRIEGETTFVRVEAKHVAPMGGGFFHLGLHLVEVVSAGDYPELASLSI
jgi:hypothetical protein